MPNALVALGANLGNRASTLDRALAALGALPSTQLVARSRWHATAPVGGPPGQQPFLNGAARIDTSLAPLDLFDSLLAIEASLGRVRSQRWEARALDLDVLLYGELSLDDPRLKVPHRRLVCRRFALDPAVEVAPWMIHPTSGWTVAQLHRQLVEGANFVAVAAGSIDDASCLAHDISQRLGWPLIDTADSEVLTLGEDAEKCVAAWSPKFENRLRRRPRLILAASPGGSDEAACRKILGLPATGPVVWLPSVADALTLPDAVAAVEAAWVLSN